jgi:ubiquinone/menaquinone biosynthesis C-methylase UbiE
MLLFYQMMMNWLKKLLLRNSFMREVLYWKHAAKIRRVQEALRDEVTGTRNEIPRWQWTIDRLKELPEGTRLLDAGAGERRFKPYCTHLRYVAQDFAQYDGQGNQAGLQTGTWDQTGLDIVCDITAIPEPDGAFGAVLCTEVLEHVPDPVLALKELARLTAPGGIMILTAPFCSITHFAPYHFSTGFSRYFYEHHLASLGLDILQICPNGDYFEYLAQELLRAPHVAEAYGAPGLEDDEAIAAKAVLNALARYSRVATSSAELLCYGYHVVAKKR